ncbi:MAG TPA: ADOP family duplicated permease, partial [Vicinamibacterales bacterium]|nr:ADOP family duplicated permease [Vicinamibacterales bacterium]
MKPERKSMRRSLRSWLWRIPIDQEVEDEVAFHVEMRTRELVERGVDPKVAREMAVSRMGDVVRLKRTCVDLGRKREREMRLTHWLEDFAHDVRFSLRQLRRSPIFALVAIVTLALGIGANSAIFALVDATLLRPLPFSDPDRLVLIREISDGGRRSGVSAPNLLDWQARSRSFDRLGGYVPAVGGVVMAGADGLAEDVPRQWVRAGIFEALGVVPIAGRTFQQDDVATRANAVVLSETFWQSRFNRDPGVIGRAIRLDGDPYTVVGVVPREAGLLSNTSLWALDYRNVPRTSYQLLVIGRMKPGVTIEAARADLGAVARSLASDYPETNKGRGVVIEPLHQALVGSDLRLTSLLFLGVVCFVLLICCANVANLLMARATVRARELAIRSALGAGRRRVIRQLLAESLVLSTLGGLLGAAIGATILGAAPSVIPPGILPGAVTLVFDVRVIVFCVLAVIAVAVLFGLAPAFQATKLASRQIIAADTRTGTGGGVRVRSMLVVGEVATAVLLLVGAGLLLRTLAAVDSVDRGYGAKQALTMMVDPLGGRYPTRESLLQFFDTVEHEIRSAPGVRDVAWSTSLPMGPADMGRLSFEIAGDPPLDPGKRPVADFQIISPAYFKTLDLPLVAGRNFDERDAFDTNPVCIVSEAFVRGHLHGQSPIGLRIATRPATSLQAKPTLREIVGVARNVKTRPDETEEAVQLYVPLTQNPLDDLYLLVRPGAGSAAALAPAVRGAIGRVDKEQLVSVRGIMTLDDIAFEATSRHRFRAVLVA